MPDVKQIRKEIVDAIKQKRDNVPDDLWKKIESELDLCEVTDGLEGKNNLKTFYNIWKRKKNDVGNKNEINSWVAYALGITSQKPDGEFLVKRRAFARAGFPDIDVDFEDSRQNDVFEYLIDTYGRDKGGRIGTHQFLTFKSCITRVTKALDLADAFHKGKDIMTTENARKVSEILSPFPKGGIIRLRGDDGEMHIIKTIKAAYEHCPDFKHYIDKYPLLKKHGNELEGTFSAFGCLSADTPILTDKGWVRIDQLSAKFKVAYINKDGEVEFTDKFNSFKTGNKKTYKLKLKDGGSVNITDEHLVFTDKGCVKFEKIRQNKEKYKIYGFKKEFEILKINKKNLNNNIYSEDVINNIIKDAGGNPVYGKIGMCDFNSLDLSKVSHIITNLRIEEDKMVGDISIINNKNGEKLKKMIKERDVVFRPQGEGCCDKDGNISNFKLWAINAICNNEDAFGENKC